MSRIGKIARLPRSVREELNWRLLDGEQQSRLVEWLNGREDVRAVLKAEFEGKAISESNMTAWAQGGFEDWRREQEAAEAAGRVVEESSAVAEAMARQAEPGGLTESRSLSDRAATMAALALAEQFMALRRMEDGKEKRRAVLKLVRGLVRLRTSDRQCERGQREAAQAARSAEMHEAWAERAQRRFDGAKATAATPPPRAGEGRGKIGEGQGIDVRRRMAEIMERMSDEQIAETLRRSGYLRGPEEDGGTVDGDAVEGVTVRTGGGEARPAKRVWWTDEDEALEGDEWDESDGAGGEAIQRGAAGSGDPALQTERVVEAVRSASTSTSMSTSAGSDASGHKAPPTVQADLAAGSGDPALQSGRASGDPPSLGLALARQA